MKLPRNLSGTELVRHLEKHWDYRKVHQVGSHMILETQSPVHHRIAIPEHSPLRIGTLNAILASVSAAKAVDKESLLKKP